MISIPSRFKPAIDRLMALREKSEYLGAFIFGSVARGDATDASDLDVKVVTEAENPAFEILHPVIGGVKLDITFESLDQLRRDLGQDSQKIPARRRFIAESIILFDKTGALQAIKAACPENPPKHPLADYPHLRFLVHHADDKVARHVISVRDAASLSMHACLEELLNIHYGVHGHWKVSSKRLLADLETWDEALSGALRAFLRAEAFEDKLAKWNEIVDHVLRPIGGRLPLDAHEPKSELSRRGLRDLLAAETASS